MKPRKRDMSLDLISDAHTLMGYPHGTVDVHVGQTTTHPTQFIVHVNVLSETGQEVRTVKLEIPADELIEREEERRRK